MKVAVSTSGGALNLPVDIRFGRAPGFLLYDTESHACSFHENVQNLQAAQGAGIQSAQNVARLGVEAVISGHCGPKAYRVLQAAKIKVYCAPEDVTAGQALTLLQAGQLPEAIGADVEGHWA